MKNKIENEQIEIKEIRGTNYLLQIEQHSRKLFYQILEEYKIPKCLSIWVDKK